MRAEKLTAVRVDNVPAGTGLLLRADEAGTYKIPSTESRTYNVNLLVGTTTATTINESVGGMANFTYRDGFFYRVEGSQQVDAGRAYLQLPATAVANVKCLSLDFNAEQIQIVGIEKIGSKSEEWAGSVYDLSGRTVNGKSVNRQMSKGLYIRAGKKVVVK